MSRLRTILQQYIPEKQFFDTLVDDEYNLNARSAFYAGQSYHDHGDYEKALKWYSLYTKLQNIWIEEEYECYLTISKCMIELKYNINDILKNISKCINIFKDKAEHHDLIGDYYLKYEMYNLAYFCFKKASEKNLEKNLKKYYLPINLNSYGINVLNKLEYVKTKMN
jgi:tetratricopeptide (TPR) repeat protein